MNKAHYIIFHPDKGRCKPIKVEATVLGSKNKWSGNIYTDNYCTGNNEDPFVFINPWVYSFCHATQLKKVERKDCFLQKDSILIFVSEQSENKNILAVDTVFVIDKIEKWGRPLQLPVNYQSHNDINSVLWSRHLFAPFDNDKKNYKGVHKTVSFTYEAKLGESESNKFSFLPLDIKNNRVLIYLDKLCPAISEKIIDKRHWKRPVLLMENEINILYNEIYKMAVTKVLKDIKPQNNIANFKSKDKC